jgi:hypothetical protein
MEIKLSVNIGATLQVKNSRGEWDWIKPEVGAEIMLNNHELRKGNDEDNSLLQGVFAQIWDDVVGPQFASVVQELINEQSPEAKEVELDAETKAVFSDEKPNTDEDDYY